METPFFICLFTVMMGSAINFETDTQIEIGQNKLQKMDIFSGSKISLLSRLKLKKEMVAKSGS